MKIMIKKCYSCGFIIKNHKKYASGDIYKCTSCGSAHFVPNEIARFSGITPNRTISRDKF